MKRRSSSTEGGTRPSLIAARAALVSRAVSTMFQPGPFTLRVLAIMPLGA